MVTEVDLTKDKDNTLFEVDSETSGNTQQQISTVTASVHPFYLLRSVGVSELHNESTVSFSDIFDGDFEFSLLGNYMVDLGFIFIECPRFLNPDVVTCILHGEKDNKMHSGMIKELAGLGAYNVHLSQVTVPDMNGTHHSKYALLFYATGVRVVITTANYIERDFKYMTQGVYVQDFPLLPSSASGPCRSSFREELVRYLEKTTVIDTFAKQLFDDSIRRLNMFDFSSAAVEIVATVPGNDCFQSSNDLFLGYAFSYHSLFRRKARFG